MTPFSKLVGYLIREKVLTEEQIARVLGPHWSVEDVREVHSPKKDLDNEPGNQVVS